MGNLNEKIAKIILAMFISGNFFSITVNAEEVNNIQSNIIKEEVKKENNISDNNEDKELEKEKTIEEKKSELKEEIIKSEKEEEKKNKNVKKKKEIDLKGKKIIEDDTFKNYSSRAAKKEIEPNDNMSTANLIKVNSGDYYTGDLTDYDYYYNDYDYYKFTLDYDAEVTLTFSHNEIPGDSNRYFNIDIRNSQNFVYLDKYSRGYDRKLEYKIGLKKGTYYIRITDGYYYTSMKYNLSITATRGNYEKEDNGEMSKATFLENNQKITGRISSYSDYDYYKLTIPNDGELTLNFETKNLPGDEYNYYQVNLMDSQLNKYISKNIKGKDGGYNEKIGIRKGTYYIQVTSYSNILEDEAYKISYMFKANENYEAEFNNTAATANVMKLNTNKIGKIKDSSDYDYFKINLNKSEIYKLNFSHPLVGNFGSYYWRIKILDSKNKEYLTINSKGGDSSITKEVYLDAGTYYIKVDNYYYDNSNVEYSINLFEQNDWKNHWAKNEIQSAMNKGWVEKADLFRPEDAITRAEFVKIVNRAFGFKTKAANEPFIDVQTNNWYYDDVRIAIKAGYITTAQNKFRPNDPISREEVAAIVTTIKKNKDNNLDKIKKYKDYNKVSKWALSSVEGAIEKGYMGQGSLEFRPTANITRAEAVVTLSRIK